MSECNCWRCQAERLFHAKRVMKMKRGGVYLRQMYSESFEEFEDREDAESFRRYADAHIDCWDFDPVFLYDLNDDRTYYDVKEMGWVAEEGEEV